MSYFFAFVMQKIYNSQMFTDEKITIKSLWIDIKIQPLFWGSILILILMTQTTQDRIAIVLRAVPNLQVPTAQWLLESAVLLKTVLFTGLLAILVMPIVKGTSFRIDQKKREAWLKSAGITALTLLILSALSLALHNRSLGIDYAEISYAPFAQDKTWLSRRLLMPFLAYILFLRGQTLYFIFFALLTGLLVFTLHRWLETFTPLPTWQFISLCTSSFIIYQFQQPGYSDVLIFVFFILAMRPKTDEKIRLIWLVLALLTHEASLFIGIWIAWFTFDKRTRLHYLLVVGFYMTLWAATFFFRVDALLASHSVDGISSVGWVLLQPGRELLGIFMAFKLLWWIPVTALFITLRDRDFNKAGFLSGMLFSGILLTFVGVDTSRLAGFSFPALLVGLQVLQDGLKTARVQKLTAVLFALNLLVPSAYIGLNAGILTWPGFYQWALDVLRSLF